MSFSASDGATRNFRMFLFMVYGVNIMDKKISWDSPKKIIRGFLAAWFLTALGMTAAGIAMMITPVGVHTGSCIIIASASAGGFLFGRACASAVGRRGILVGLLAGIILSLSLLAAYLLFFGMTLNDSLNLFPLIFPVGAASFGGISGVFAGGNVK